MLRPPPISTRTDTLFPYTTLFRSHQLDAVTDGRGGKLGEPRLVADGQEGAADGNQVGHLGGPRLAMGRRGPPSPAEPIRQPFERFTRRRGGAEKKNLRAEAQRAPSKREMARRRRIFFLSLRLRVSACTNICSFFSTSARISYSPHPHALPFKPTKSTICH